MPGLLRCGVGVVYGYEGRVVAMARRWRVEVVVEAMRVVWNGLGNDCKDAGHVVSVDAHAVWRVDVHACSSVI